MYANLTLIWSSIDLMSGGLSTTDQPFVRQGNFSFCNNTNCSSTEYLRRGFNWRNVNSFKVSSPYQGNFSSCNNTNCSSTEYLRREFNWRNVNSFKLTSALLVCLGIFIILFNSVILLVYFSLKHKLKKKTANFLLANQAMVDLFHGLITNGVTVFLHSEFIIWQSLVQFSMTLSLHTVVILSLERYLFFLHPLFHRKHVTSGRIRTVVLVTWLSALLFIPFRVAHFVVGSERIDWREYTIYYIAISDVVVGVILIAVSYMYIATYRCSKQFLSRTYNRSKGHLNEKADAEEQRRLRRHYVLKGHKVTKLFIYMFVAFIASYLPMFVSGLVHISVPNYSYYTPTLRKIIDLDFFMYLSSCLSNPLMTLAYKAEYRKGVLKLFQALSVRSASGQEVGNEGEDETQILMEKRSSLRPRTLSPRPQSPRSPSPSLLSPSNQSSFSKSSRIE